MALCLYRAANPVLHRAVSAFAFAQTALLVAASPVAFSADGVSVVGVGAGVTLALGALGVLAVARRTLDRVVLDMQLAGNGETVVVSTAGLVGGVRRTSILVSSFAPNAPWGTPGRGLWHTIRFRGSKGAVRTAAFARTLTVAAGPDMLLLGRGGAVPNVALLNRVIQAQH